MSSPPCGSTMAPVVPVPAPPRTTCVSRGKPSRGRSQRTGRRCEGAEEGDSYDSPAGSETFKLQVVVKYNFHYYTI